MKLNKVKIIGAGVVAGLIATFFIKGSPTDVDWQSFLLNWFGWSTLYLAISFPFWDKKENN